MLNDNRFVDEKIRLISKEKSILDTGGGYRFQKWLKKYEPLFKDCDYKTFDNDSTTGADIIGDIHNIPLEDGSVDAVICSSVLEHVADPAQAVKEMFRILKDNGKFFAYIPSTYPYHAKKGHYQDYWRFFDGTIRMLFKEFSRVEIVKNGGYFYAISFFIPGRHKFGFLLDPLCRTLDNLFRTERRNTTLGYYVYAIK